MRRIATALLGLSILGCAGIGKNVKFARPDCDLPLGDASLPSSQLPRLTAAPTGLAWEKTRVPLLLSPATISAVSATGLFLVDPDPRWSSYGEAKAADTLAREVARVVLSVPDLDAVTIAATGDTRTGWVALALAASERALAETLGGTPVIELMGASTAPPPVPDPPNPLLAGQLLMTFNSGDPYGYQALVDQTLQGCPDVYYAMGQMSGIHANEWWGVVCSEDMTATVASCPNAADVVTLWLVQRQHNEAHTQVAVTVTLDSQAAPTEVGADTPWGEVLPTLSSGPLNLVLRPTASGG